MNCEEYVCHVTIASGEEDIESLNKLAVSEWEDITGVALLLPHKDNLIEFLPRYGLDLKVRNYPTQRHGNGLGSSLLWEWRYT